MLVSKLFDGVIVVQVGTSRRALRPKFVRRIMLAWVFRHFASLPMAVLTQWQKNLIVAVMAQGVIIPVPREDSNTIIGTVEGVTTPTVRGKSLAPSTDWEYVRRRAAGNRASA
jgi:hypothetical protein